ncbi:MAG: glutamyl-tRNA reductase [Crocinitomicaceae bacterium]|jgi:glutamyl-tRNA reductase|nr:glutamyl-tRNA reductase [Crocinitomicaceae bacterium]MDG2463942.1 glutamyl-tRNA reductase [Crocinitomicaceae bacterium]
MYAQFQVIAFTHSNLDVAEIGLLHIEEDERKVRLAAIKAEMNWSELLFLSTCNRVEFFFCGESSGTEEKLFHFFRSLYPKLPQEKIDLFVSNTLHIQGERSMEHLLRVASSIDSLVVGEREIITQVRKSYEQSHKLGLAGDFIRLAVKQTIETAKKVYTETSISKKPVSVVSLAYHRLRELNIPLDARIIIVGAGVTNTTLSRFLRKHGYTNFVVFNRTLSKGETLANDLNGAALPLSELNDYTNGFDVLISCTGADTHLVSPEIYKNILQGETDKKVVIDIAIPQDIDPAIIDNHNVHHISVSLLQKISDNNLKERSSEISHVEQIISWSLTKFNLLQKERNVELAMRDVPQKVKEIKSMAMNEVFKNDLDNLDKESKEILEKILGYMEKKYMSVPMKMAKEILLKSK